MHNRNQAQNYITCTHTCIHTHIQTNVRVYNEHQIHIRTKTLINTQNKPPDRDDKQSAQQQSTQDTTQQQSTQDTTQQQSTQDTTQQQSTQDTTQQQSTQDTTQQAIHPGHNPTSERGDQHYLQFSLFVQQVSVLRQLRHTSEGLAPSCNNNTMRG